MLHLKTLYIFDWDGTLLNSNNTVINAHMHAMAHFGITNVSRSDLETMLGMDRHSACQRITQHSNDDPETYYQKFRFYYEQEMHNSQLFGGSDSVLMILKNQGKKVALATNKASHFAQYEVEQCAVDQYFDFMAFADLSRPKPDPAMLIQIMQDLEVPAAETVMIGDQIADIESAVNAGVQSYTLVNDDDDGWKKWPESVFKQTTVLDMDGLLLGLCPKKDHLHQDERLIRDTDNMH